MCRCRQPWCREQRVFGGQAGWPWSIAGAASTPPSLPNADAVDASHFRLLFHEDWTGREADDVIAILKKVDRALGI